MLKRTVICDRCGSIVKAEHPNRISIYKHSIEAYIDYWGKPHKKSVYKADAPIHFCEECESKFNEFMEMNR